MKQRPAIDSREVVPLLLCDRFEPSLLVINISPLYFMNSIHASVHRPSLHVYYTAHWACVVVNFVIFFAIPVQTLLKRGIFITQRR